ncbi:MAG: DNA repair protein RadA, partial [Solirubrobacteraceae bacterium]
MPRSDTVFVCSACGHEAARWAGRCPDCAEWNTFVEQRRPSAAAAGRGGAVGAP